MVTSEKSYLWLSSLKVNSCGETLRFIFNCTSEASFTVAVVQQPCPLSYLTYCKIIKQPLILLKHFYSHAEINKDFKNHPQTFLAGTITAEWLVEPGEPVLWTESYFLCNLGIYVISTWLSQRKEQAEVKLGKMKACQESLYRSQMKRPTHTVSSQVLHTWPRLCCVGSSTLVTPCTSGTPVPWLHVIRHQVFWTENTMTYA